jgi:predicted dehydrogenase
VTTTFATIGSGRRSRFFLRLARAMPERLRAQRTGTQRARRVPGDFYTGVVDMLRHGAPPPVDPADAVTTLTVLEAARRSATERRVVTLGIAR